MSFDSTERMFANALPAFIISRVFPDVFIVTVNSMPVHAAMDDTLVKFGAMNNAFYGLAVPV